jgi:hypothetical protein
MSQLSPPFEFLAENGDVPLRDTMGAVLAGGFVCIL